MTSALPRLYCGPLEHLAVPTVAAELPDDAMPAERLLEPGVLDELLERFAAQYQGDDLKAVASLWSKWHFSAMAAHTLASNLLLERDLPVALDQMGLYLSDSGQTTGIALPHEGTPLGSLDAFERFERLLQGHVAPLVDMLGCVSGASPKVFWSNFGNYFEYFAKAAVHHPMASPGLGDEALRLIDHRVYPDGRRNPLFMPVRYLPDEHGETQRTRRLCCLRYRLEDFGCCGNCPLDDAAVARASSTTSNKTSSTTGNKTSNKTRQPRTTAMPQSTGAVVQTFPSRGDARRLVAS